MTSTVTILLGIDCTMRLSAEFRTLELFAKNETKIFQFFFLRFQRMVHDKKCIF